MQGEDQLDNNPFMAKSRWEADRVPICNVLMKVGGIPLKSCVASAFLAPGTWNPCLVKTAYGIYVVFGERRPVPEIRRSVQIFLQRVSDVDWQGYRGTGDGCRNVDLLLSWNFSAFLQGPRKGLPVACSLETSRCQKG